MENPPPYNPDPQAPNYPPQVTPGYPPQQEQPGYPQAPPQPPSYPQPTPGYPPQCTYGYQSTSGYPTGYPSEPTKGHAPPTTGYPPPAAGYPPPPTGYPPPPTGYPPPQGHGYIQQPASSHVSNSNTTVVLAQPPVVTTAVLPPPQDHMGLSIFACLCCCWILGIFAIIKSSEARNRYMVGDYAGAAASAQSAKNLSIAAIVCGISIGCIVFIIRIVAITSQ